MQMVAALLEQGYKCLIKEEITSTTLQDIEMKYFQDKEGKHNRNRRKKVSNNPTTTKPIRPDQFNVPHVIFCHCICHS